MPIKYSRAIVDAIHSGTLEKAETVEDRTFGFAIPTECPGVPSEVLVPKNTWKDPRLYDETARKLALLFEQNFAKYADLAHEETRAAGPLT